MSQQTKYIHTSEIHNLDAPKAIVPFLINKFYPQSVADVGCGIGTFLQVLLENGISDIVGIDGDWVNRSELFIPEKYFVERDLEKDLNINRRFDMVLCLEVAEHLSEKIADNFIKNLTQLSDLIIFSAAIPNQGGQNHLNEQHFNYWIEKFAKRGFIFYDVFRTKFWNNEKVNWWYKQNMFLVVHNSVDVSKYKIDANASEPICEYIHPDLLALYSNELRKYKSKLGSIKEGKASGKLYLHLLKKKIISKFKK